MACLTACTCWVSREPPDKAFGIRFGAHETSCSQYRESQDPVDRKNDTELRGLALAGKLRWT